MKTPTSRRIRDLRISKDLTQDQFAQMLYLTGSDRSRHIRHLESGARSPSGPVAFILEDIANEIISRPITKLRIPTSKQILALRTRLGLTQRQLGEMLYLSKADPGRHIRYLESGKREPSGPLVRALEIIARNAHVRVPWRNAR